MMLSTMGGTRATDRSKNGHKPSQAKGAVREREAGVMRLFKAGKTYDEICAETGLANRSSVATIVKRVLQRNVVEDVEEIRAVEISRIDEMFTSIWDEAKTGSLPHQEAALKLMKERRKYLPGLEAPQQHLIEVDQRVQALVLQLEAQLDAPEADGE